MKILIFFSLIILPSFAHKTVKKLLLYKVQEIFRYYQFMFKNQYSLTCDNVLLLLIINLANESQYFF